MGEGFQPPRYPYDRLSALKEIASKHEMGAVDLSVGTPCDPPPGFIIEAMAKSGTERGYPPSIGSAEFRGACAGWLERRFGIEVPAAAIAACVGTKEFVASLPHFLSLRFPGRDTVLLPTLAYPTYEMGAALAGLRSVRVPLDPWGRMDLAAIDESDAARALLIWVNSPGNPAGQLEDLGAISEWGRSRGILVASDECYAEFTWASEPRTILEHGSDGVLAVHSLSKRSNLAGVRAGFYCGDDALVQYLALVRSHAGMMVPGPVQAAAAAAYSDDGHVQSQREIYLRRLGMLLNLMDKFGSKAEMPGGGFYLWARAPGRDDGVERGVAGAQDGEAAGAAWDFATQLATEVGVVVSPGEFYGSAGTPFVRVAAVQPEERIELALARK